MLVLTYHSISDAGGPTSIPPAVFAMQMEALAGAGYRSQRLEEFIGWHDAQDGDARDQRRVLITFDDGFADFAEVAAPILHSCGFSALVFVPTQKLGAREDWDGANQPARPLMDWETVRALAAEGIEFGGHSRTHADLTRLDPAAREREIAGCAKDLAAQTGTSVDGFAAPYGRVSPGVVEAIGRHYRVAFGTRLALARRGHDRFDVPRIEMHYFRHRRRWAGFLEGRLGYFRARQGLRAIKSFAGGGIG
jgi:peptidoglycan/xylan/chitin deacetylase (PgdA/CDA1 family)